MYSRLNQITGGSDTLAKVNKGDEFVIPSKVTITLAGVNYDVPVSINEATTNPRIIINGNTISFNLEETDYEYMSLGLLVKLDNPKISFSFYYHFEYGELL